MDTSVLFTKTRALFTLAGNVFFLTLLLCFVFARPMYKRVMDVIGAHALSIGLFVTTGATIGSLIYSEVVGYPACILCWIQRIFMYPQMFLFGLALWRREYVVLPYILLLTFLGGGVALYHWIKDMLALFTHVTIPCPAVSALPSCDKIFVQEFSYITIPMIALNAFILIAVVAYAGMRTKDSHAPVVS